jgi:ADP-heptose:LPS heptosyltransferase
VFHPGSARIEKFWQPQRWAEVIMSAMARWHVTAVLTGGGSAQEKAHLAEIEALLPRPTSDSGPGIVDLSGKIDLLTLAALIAQTRLLVTVDSAPVHLAAAVGTPQVILLDRPIRFTGTLASRQPLSCRAIPALRCKTSPRDRTACQ